LGKRKKAESFENKIFSLVEIPISSPLYFKNNSSHFVMFFSFNKAMNIINILLLILVGGKFSTLFDHLVLNMKELKKG
jgi:hypothetical protein